MKSSKAGWMMTVGILTAGWLSFSVPAEINRPAEKPPLRAAIFVQNRAGKAFQDKIDVLNDMIATRLSGEGFSVIDKHDVVERFRESRDRDPESEKLLQKLSGEDSGVSVEEALEDASALRLAQMIGADYMIVATINSFGRTTKKFKGEGTIYGVDNEITSYTLRLALKVMEADQGGTVYGNLIKVSENIPALDNLQIETSDIINDLLDAGAAGLARHIAGEADRVRSAKVKHIGTVPFTVVTNIPAGMVGATVELDGAVIGSSGPGWGQFNAPPGIHMMRITREWCAPWERTVNIYANQKLMVALELSEEGVNRWKDIENFKAEMAKKAAETEKIEAEAYAERLIAEGEKARREASYERIDTSKVERLSIGEKGFKREVNVEIEEDK